MKRVEKGRSGRGMVYYDRMTSFKETVVVAS